MRKIGVVAAVGVVLIVGALAVWVVANPNRHRERIQAQLRHQFGREVILGEMSLGFLPLRFHVASPRIAEDPSIGDELQPFIQADNLDVQIPFLPLLSGGIQIDSLELVHPRIELIRTKSGAWNFSTLGRNPIGTTSAAADGDTSSGFALSRLRIADGQIGLTDLQQGQSRIVYDHIDLTLLNYAPQQSFLFELAAHLPGEGAQEVRFKGNGGPVAAGRPAETPFQGTLSLNEVGIEPLTRFLNTTAIGRATGVLSGDSEISNQSGTVSSRGKLKLDDAHVNGLAIGYPIDLDYNVVAGSSTGLVTINTATLQLGNTALTLAGSLNSSLTPATMDLKIKSGDVSIAEVGRLASAFGIAFGPQTSIKGTVNADISAKGAVSKPALTGTIAGHDLEISGQGIPQPVRIKSVDLALSPTSIQSNEFTATSGQTAVGVRLALRQYSSLSPSADISLRSAGATLPEMQSIAKAYGMSGLDQITGEGFLNFDMRANGPLKSLSTEAVLQALDGTINLDFSPLKIAGFDTVYKLGTLLGSSSKLSEQSATDIVKLTGRVLVKNGVAQSDDLKLNLLAGILTAAGTADLVSETLNLKALAVFSKPFINKIGLGGASGVMNVAFSNAAGDIVIPALVTGTFKQPKFAPDVKTYAQLQKQRLVPSLTNPAGAIIDVLGAFKRKADPGTPQEPSERKPSGFRGLLDRLGGKKAEEPK